MEDAVTANGEAIQRAEVDVGRRLCGRILVLHHRGRNILVEYVDRLLGVDSVYGLADHDLRAAVADICVVACSISPVVIS